MLYNPSSNILPDYYGFEVESSKDHEFVGHGLNPGGVYPYTDAVYTNVSPSAPWACAMVNNPVTNWSRPAMDCYSCKFNSECPNLALLPPDILCKLGIISMPDNTAEISAELAKDSLELGAVVVGFTTSYMKNETKLTGLAIKKRAEAIAGQVVEQQAEANDPVTLMVILDGARTWAGLMHDELTQLGLKFDVDYLQVKSYVGDASGEINYEKQPKQDMSGRRVILLEDIADTGKTLDFLQKDLAERGAKSVQICAMLNKPSKRKYIYKQVTLDWCGFDIVDEFVIGMGLDYKQLGRELSDVRAVRELTETDESI
jgi:hypoxanthine phosphoribosyltransferase